MKKRLLIGDACVILLSLGAALCGMMFLFRKDSAQNAVDVRVQNHVVATLALDENGDYPIDGTDVTLRVRDGKAFILSADCDDKICMHMAPVTKDSHPRYAVICLPNAVTVSLHTAEGEVNVLAG